MVTGNYSLRDERIMSRRRPASRNIDWNQREIALAYDYLTNPVKQGVWKLELQWRFGEGLTSYIQKELLDTAKEGFKLKSRVVRVDTRQLKELVSRTETFSFLFSLFASLLKQEEKVETLDEYLSANEEDDLIFSVLDMNKLRAEYADALTAFKEGLYYDNMRTSFDSSMSKVKDGMFYISIAPRDRIRHRDYAYHGEEALSTKSKTIEILAFEKEPLEKIYSFLSLLGKASDFVCYKVYSPEEELLSIYTKVTEVMLPYVVSSKPVRALFIKMMSDYKDDSPTATISTAGQVGEECLTQLYETLHRKPVPQNMTLGALRDSISEYTKKMKKVKNSTISNKNDAQKEIKDKITAAKTLNKQLLMHVSKILLEIDDANHKSVVARLRTLEGIENDYSVFPQLIRTNLNNLLRLRNIVSHKSIDPVGMSEALQSVYYSLSLYIWWDTQRKRIDWSKDNREIVHQFISAASNYDS